MLKVWETAQAETDDLYDCIVTTLLKLQTNDTDALSRPTAIQIPSAARQLTEFKKALDEADSEEEEDKSAAVERPASPLLAVAASPICSETEEDDEAVFSPKPVGWI